MMTFNTNFLKIRLLPLPLLIELFHSSPYLCIVFVFLERLRRQHLNDNIERHFPSGKWRILFYGPMLPATARATFCPSIAALRMPPA